MEKKRLNTLVHMGYQSPPTQAAGVFPFSRGEVALRPPRSDLRSPGKISRLGGYPCTRWEFGQKIVGEKKRGLNNLVYVGYQ